MPLRARKVTALLAAGISALAVLAGILVVANWSLIESTPQAITPATTNPTPPTPPQPQDHRPRLHIKVVSAADGTPVADATVDVRRSAIFHTDATGSVEIDTLAPRSWDLWISAPNRAKIDKQVDLQPGENAVVFSLPDGGTVSGKVTDAQRRPLNGIGVNVNLKSWRVPFEFLRTGLDGTFDLENFPLGQECQVLFADDAYVDHWEIITLSQNQRHRELQIVLQPQPPGGTIAGTVSDADGKPVGGARVEVAFTGPRNVKAARTDSTGAFRLTGVRPDGDMPIQIVVRANGWAPATAFVKKAGTPDAPATVAVQLTERGHHITGRVVNEAGHPISGVRVGAGPIDRTYNDPRMVFARSSGNGAFHFDSLAAADSFQFTARGYTDIDFKELPVDGPGDVTVVMQSLGGISGKVVDADTGQPITHFTLETLHWEMDQKQEIGGNSGEFRLDGLSGDRAFTLVVSADGYPTQYFDGIRPGKGAGAQPVILHLSKNPAGHIRVAGKIVDAAGKPIAGVDVRAIVYMKDDRNFPRDIRFHWTMLRSGQLKIQDYIRTIEEIHTGDDGTFDFPSLPGDDVDLAYWADGVPQGHLADIGQQPAAQREHLNIRVPSPATLNGRINAQVYSGVTSIELRGVADPSFDMSVAISGNGENYRIRDISPGDYELRILGKSISNPNGTFYFPEIGSAKIQLKEGESRQFDLGFGKGDVPTTQADRRLP
jgi:hypothetical protein